MSRLEQLARGIKEQAAALGFGAAGIAEVGPSPYGGFLQRWLDEGHAGKMEWMRRSAAERRDPRARFAWARTAIVVSSPYLPYRGDRRAQQGLARNVARYALGEDYHDVMGTRLGRLAEFLAAEKPGIQMQPYVDSGPVLERDLAARAGLGWFGKSTNLIGPRGDSWILLGVILTDAELPVDRPTADHCGSCTACIDACPTAAIREPYRVDSTRCISYLTIELRGTIPAGQHKDLDDWVFGCDICQEVCPWNRKVQPTADVAFHPGAHLETATLADLMGLDATRFEARFRRTPLSRSKRRGLVRNALIVAANTGDGRALDAGQVCLEDSDPVIRATAARSLGRAGGRLREAIGRARSRETDPEVRQDMDEALDA